MSEATIAPPPKKPMSKGLKIGIGIFVGLIVLVFIINTLTPQATKDRLAAERKASDSVSSLQALAEKKVVDNAERRRDSLLKTGVAVDRKTITDATGAHAELLIDGPSNNPTMAVLTTHPKSATLGAEKKELENVNRFLSLFEKDAVQWVSTTLTMHSTAEVTHDSTTIGRHAFTLTSAPEGETVRLSIAVEPARK